MAMPRSTVSAVRTPGSVSPRSTSVIATTGRIPTTTVSASSTLAMPAMSDSMRPMKESTSSSEEMSISTPRAPVSAIRWARSSCSAIAIRSCMSTWMLTSSRWPSLRTGMRLSTACLLQPVAPAGDLVARTIERDHDGVGQAGLGRDVLQVQPEVHDRLRDLRPDAGDDAVGAHQAGGGDGLEQVLGDERVDRRDAGDVDDRQRRVRLDDLLEQALHHDLRARGVQRADQRQRDHPLPELDHRRGELHQLLLLALDDLLARAQEGLG